MIFAVVTIICVMIGAVFVYHIVKKDGKDTAIAVVGLLMSSL